MFGRGGGVTTVNKDVFDELMRYFLYLKRTPCQLLITA